MSVSMKKLAEDDGETKSAMEVENPAVASDKQTSIMDKIIAKFAVLIIDHPFKLIGIFLVILAIVVVVDALYFELDSIDDHACM